MADSHEEALEKAAKALADFDNLIAHAAGNVSGPAIVEIARQLILIRGDLNAMRFNVRKMR